MLVLPAERTRSWVSVAFGVAMVTLTAVPLLLIGAVLFLPTAVQYRLTPDDLVVHASWGPVPFGRTIRRHDIGAVRPTTLVGAMHHNGGQVPGFCVGSWFVPELGHLWVATDCGLDVVSVEAGGETLLLSPSDSTAFISAIQTPGSTRTDTLAPTPRALPRSSALWAAAPLMGLGILLIRMGRRGFPLSYRIEDAVLSVPGHLGRVRVRLRGATARRAPLCGAFRALGTALPGLLYLGLFRGLGRWLHCAATSLQTGWLVVGDRAVYVNPADAAAFEAALRAAGARMDEPGAGAR